MARENSSSFLRNPTGPDTTPQGGQGEPADHTPSTPSSALSGTDQPKTAHTPGPWQMDIGNGQITAPPSEAGEPREPVAVMRASCVTARWEADARLIAAAPDLLASLIEMRAVAAAALRILAIGDENLVDCLIADTGVPAGFGVRAAIAIAKAQGR